ncbi:MAG TPA: hypothetical protein VHR72_08130, partial [Gemmataceae bacterium]|nr:hypothetical protein [Gemmataceae bacterium]
AMCLSLAGCGQAGPGGKVAVPVRRAEEPDAPVGDAVADPKLREARTANDAILVELLTGKGEGSGQARLIEKTKDFRTFSVKSQKLVRDDTAEFGGLLNGPKGRAGFRLTLVKQTGGRWAIATFSGPNPE